MITWEDFKTQALSFYSKSVDSNDTWEWSQVLDRPGFGFLMKRKATVLSHPTNNTVSFCEDPLFNNQDDEIHEIIEAEDDQATLQTDSAPHLHIYDVHIVYSNTYQQPVLYFNCYTPDGKPLSHTQILENMQKLNGTDIQPYISQKEHPVLGKPYFHLHPCETGKLMADVLDDNSETSGSYLLSWITIAAPVLGIQIPLLYFK